MAEPSAARQHGARFLVGVSWLGAAAASVCFCVNLLFVEDRAALWKSNELDPVQRRLFVVSMIVSAALPALIAAIAIRRRSLVAVADDVWLWGEKSAIVYRKNIQGWNNEMYINYRTWYTSSHPLWFTDGTRK